jgi:CheY-like chemotaxis protein
VQTQSQHIFYTDDDPDDRELFRGALYEVDASLTLTVLDSGENLLAELLSVPRPVPRLIFLDLNMPRKDGYEVLQALRSSDSLKHYPVVVFSTTSDPGAVDRAKRMGANLFVPKPHSYNGMKQAIKTCVNMDWQHFDVSGANYLMCFS